MEQEEDEDEENEELKHKKNTYDLKLLPSTLKSWNMKRSWSNKLRSWRNNLNCMTMRARRNMKKTLK